MVVVGLQTQTVYFETRWEVRSGVVKLHQSSGLGLPDKVTQESAGRPGGSVGTLCKAA